jgi:hypothetical protein
LVIQFLFVFRVNCLGIAKGSENISDPALPSSPPNDT